MWPEASSTTGVLLKGTGWIGREVGEEGLEVALAAVAQGEAATVSEAADLLFHLILLLKVKDLTLAQVVAELRQRHAQRAG